MQYHNFVGQLAKEYAAPCLMAFLFILFLFSGLSFLSFADGDEINHFKVKKFQKFNFVTAGDFGCGDEPNRTIDGMVEKNPELVIALGDLSYKKSALCWFNTIIPLDNGGRVKIAFGEHDLDKKLVSYNDYIKHFNLTNPYYSFNYQTVHFLAMATAKNSIIPYQKGSDQYNFVEQDLRNAHSNKSIDWIIVYSFRPFYSSLTAHSGQEVLPDTYHPLFDKYGVDIVLQAHNHNYQRTFPLNYNESSFFLLFHPTIAEKDKTAYKDPKGPIFLTVGTGGAELHNFTGNVPYVVEQFQSHGFLNIDITNSAMDLKLVGTFYENTDMNKKDHFIVTKQK